MGCDGKRGRARLCRPPKCVYKQLHHPLHRESSIHQPKSTDVVITTPGALGRWSHTTKNAGGVSEREKLHEGLRLFGHVEPLCK